MAKQNACVIGWGEITFEASTTGDKEVMLTRPTTDAEIAQLIQELRDLNNDEQDEEGNYFFEPVGISHCPRSTTIEWSCERGFHSLTVVAWL